MANLNGRGWCPFCTLSELSGSVHEYQPKTMNRLVPNDDVCEACGAYCQVAFRDWWDVVDWIVTERHQHKEARQ